MSVAWVFPGQGSQYVGMGRALAQAEPAARLIFETADRVLGFRLSQIIFEGPAEELQATRNQQPALLAVSVAYARVLQQRGLLPAPCCIAGHSLGEYTALVVADSLALDDALRIVRRRGELMEQYAAGGMIAVIGLDRAVLEEIAYATGAEVANINAPGQITLSGTQEALAAATALARERGARRVVPLPVNAAFHSSLMHPVIEGLRPLVAGVSLRPPIAPLIANVDARPRTDPDEIREAILAQIAAPVRWIDVVQTAVSLGAQTFYEVGPGRVLAGLIPRIVPYATVHTAEALLPECAADKPTPPTRSRGEEVGTRES